MEIELRKGLAAKARLSLTPLDEPFAWCPVCGATFAEALKDCPDCGIGFRRHRVASFSPAGGEVHLLLGPGGSVSATVDGKLVPLDLTLPLRDGWIYWIDDLGDRAEIVGAPTTDLEEEHGPAEEDGHELVAKAGLLQQPGWMYVVDAEGDILGGRGIALVAGERRKGLKERKLVRTGVECDKGFFYYLDRRGDVRRAPAP